MATRRFVMACAAANNRHPKMLSENNVRDRIAKELGGVTEVSCAFGRIDVLTPHHVIEVKTAKRYKEAIGQVLVYSLCFPTRKPKVHLYDISPENITKAYTACLSLGVELTYDYIIPRAPDT